jgi:RNA polymerase subunit RPABC4/transcription elongation factor Spt4
MKTCRACRTQIDERASVCPQCRSKQPSPKWPIFLLLLAVGIIGSAVSKKDTAVTATAPAQTETEEERDLKTAAFGQVFLDYCSAYMTPKARYMTAAIAGKAEQKYGSEAFRRARAEQYHETYYQQGDSFCTSWTTSFMRG